MMTQLLASPMPGLMTADEFYEFAHRPENRNRLFELDRGRIEELIRSGAKHGVVCANVCCVLGNFTATRRRGVLVSNNVGLILERDPDTVFGPDIFLFDEVIDFDDLPLRWEDRPPTLVVEVLSPHDLASKMNRRIGRYLAMGAPLVWVLDPAIKTLTVHQTHRPLVVLDADDEATGFEFIPDLKIEVSECFATPSGVKS
jgi:Uma2 family endonuclease